MVTVVEVERCSVTWLVWAAKRQIRVRAIGGDAGCCLSRHGKCRCLKIPFTRDLDQIKRPYLFDDIHSRMSLIPTKKSYASSVINPSLFINRSTIRTDFRGPSGKFAGTGERRLNPTRLYGRFFLWGPATTTLRCWSQWSHVP